MTRIVYLDEPSYLPKFAEDGLRELGEFEVFEDRPSTEQVIERLKDADVAIVEWTALPEEVFVNQTRLKHVVLVTTGYSKVDLEAARKAGVTVSNTPEYSRQSVAEHAIGLILQCAKRIREADQRVRSKPDARYVDHSIGVQLYGKTIGVLGLGSIGTWIAKIAQGFGMNVIAYNRSETRMPEVAQVGLDELLSSSDVVAVALPNSLEVAALLDRDKLSLMKEGSILVNISGNRCLDQVKVAEMLQSGHLYGAGLDSHISDELANAPNLIRTAGTAWYTQSALDRNLEMVVETVRKGLDGNAPYVVN